MLPVFRNREDKLLPWLQTQLSDMLFTEVPAEYLAGEADLSFMEKVPLPVRKEELYTLSESGLSALSIADNIAVVIGSNTHFKYAEPYLRFLNKLFDRRLIDVFAGKSGEAFKIGDYKKAMAYVRAGMMFRDDDLKAMFSYACGCRYWYLQLEGSEEDTELISILKAEASEYFEHVTSAFPEYAPGWYFLGYAYVNAGQYLKARIAWHHYMGALTEEEKGSEEAKEIEGRLAELEHPVNIEKGVGLLSAGRLQEGLSVLEPYVQTEYAKWWPLHFHLAGAYRELGHSEEAIEGYLNVLKLSPSNTDAMDALSELYLLAGDDEKSLKYANKAALIRKQSEEDDK